MLRMVDELAIGAPIKGSKSLQRVSGRTPWQTTAYYDIPPSGRDLVHNLGSIVVAHSASAATAKKESAPIISLPIHPVESLGETCSFAERPHPALCRIYRIISRHQAREYGKCSLGLQIQYQLEVRTSFWDLGRGLVS